MIIEATFDRLGNDLFWRTGCLDCFSTVRWFGYDDLFWWNQVSKAKHVKRRVCSCGKVFEIDFKTNEVQEIKEEVKV